MKNTLAMTKKILQEHNLKANKRFGQNFLINDTILEDIVAVSNITKDDLVIEIGPGLGNLTAYLLEKAGHVLAVEIDRNMIAILQERFPNESTLTVIEGDILKQDIDQHIAIIEENTHQTFQTVKVVANLPYYITTPIIFQLLQGQNRISDVTVMVQKEVAERMVATPKSKAYGILTVMVSYLAKANIALIVPNDSFIPAPDVTSAVIHLEKQKLYSVENETLLFDLIHASFAKRRKKMINSLEMSHFRELDKKTLEMLFEACELSTNTRAEELTLAQFIQLSKIIADKTAQSK